MAKLKLTKTAVDAAQPRPQDAELRDIVVPGFLYKIKGYPLSSSCASITGWMSR